MSPPPRKELFCVCKEILFVSRQHKPCSVRATCEFNGKSIKVIVSDRLYDIKTCSILDIELNRVTDYCPYL